MKYEGNLEDLVQFGICEKITTRFVIKFQGVAYCIGKKELFSSEGYAKRALRDHIYGNFCQGHYWHNGKNNTFSKNKGWDRNGGVVSRSREEFKVFAKEMTDQLLKDKIFTIETIVL